MAAKLPVYMQAISSFESYFLDVGKKLPINPVVIEARTAEAPKF